jgi:hypothetical protein
VQIAISRTVPIKAIVSVGRRFGSLSRPGMMNSPTQHGRGAAPQRTSFRKLGLSRSASDRSQGPPYDAKEAQKRAQDLSQPWLVRSPTMAGKDGFLPYAKPLSKEALTQIIAGTFANHGGLVSLPVRRKKPPQSEKQRGVNGRCQRDQCQDPIQHFIFQFTAFI